MLQIKMLVSLKKHSKVGMSHTRKFDNEKVQTLSKYVYKTNKKAAIKRKSKAKMWKSKLKNLAAFFSLFNFISCLLFLFFFGFVRRAGSGERGSQLEGVEVSKWPPPKNKSWLLTSKLGPQKSMDPQNSPGVPQSIIRPFLRGDVFVITRFKFLSLGRENPSQKYLQIQQLTFVPYRCPLPPTPNTCCCVH